MDDRLEQLWCTASAVRADVADSPLGFRLEELMAELKAIFSEREVKARASSTL
jgi:hypothetical protein